ncbi:MAG: hypothetical protein DMG04_02070 [Acidobacteria bacterium]|nr:MAG: hypothetical protein DMG04_02070 [Acidobacteriota bacterium]PYQ86472.1 MAG: hypothetical protein DMG03_06940 [Acidobacteriota bacterium]PYQ86686.1 MAG: hypothetical protein DMG02_23580 [Acidobacteriota bacterium]PYR02175.1 MAG: hypothetical protein DMG00_29540 [Acidobacteriota bacterium]
MSRDDELWTRESKDATPRTVLVAVAASLQSCGRRVGGVGAGVGRFMMFLCGSVTGFPGGVTIASIRARQAANFADGHDDRGTGNRVRRSPITDSPKT